MLRFFTGLVMICLSPPALADDADVELMTFVQLIDNTLTLGPAPHNPALNEAAMELIEAFPREHRRNALRLVLDILYYPEEDMPKKVSRYAEPDIEHLRDRFAKLADEVGRLTRLNLRQSGDHFIVQANGDTYSRGDEQHEIRTGIIPGTTRLTVSESKITSDLDMEITTSGGLKTPFLHATGVASILADGTVTAQKFFGDLTAGPGTSTFTGGISAQAWMTLAGNLTVDTDTLKVDATNNRVGILTTTPDVELHVGKGVAGRNEVRVESSDAGPAALGLKTSNHHWECQLDTSSNFLCRDVTNNKVPFVVEPNSPSNTLRVDSNGRIGVNLAAPGEALDVSGNIKASGTVEAGGAVFHGALASAPSGPNAGDFYFDTTTNKHRGYDGTAWNDFY